MNIRDFISVMANVKEAVCANIAADNDASSRLVTEIDDRKTECPKDVVKDDNDNPNINKEIKSSFIRNKESFNNFPGYCADEMDSLYNEGAYQQRINFYIYF